MQHRSGRFCPGLLSGRRRAWLDQPPGCGRADASHTTAFCVQSTGTGTRCSWLLGLLLSLFGSTGRATYVHQQHAIQNPSGFDEYGEHAWGIIASEGPIQGTNPVVMAGRTF